MFCFGTTPFPNFKARETNQTEFGRVLASPSVACIPPHVLLAQIDPSLNNHFRLSHRQTNDFYKSL